MHAAKIKSVKYQNLRGGEVNRNKPQVYLIAALMAAVSLQACSDQDSEDRAARESFEESAERFRDGVEDLGERAEESAEELGKSARSTAKNLAERTERAAEDVGNAARATLDTSRQKAREFIDERREAPPAD